MIEHILTGIDPASFLAWVSMLFLVGYTWTTWSGADDVVFSQVNTLQTEKMDRDGEIPWTGVSQWDKGGDVASAAMLLLGTDGNYFDITGTDGITSVHQLAVGGNHVQVGTITRLHFDGVCAITHNATSLVLLGAANITTAAGDELTFVCFDSTNQYWRCVCHTSLTGQVSIPKINLPGGQIVFPAAQNPSAGANTLDDYEEKSWTPDLQFGGAKVGITYTLQGGQYTKIGRVVCLTGAITLSSKGSSNGNASIEGLPFTSLNDDGAYSTANIRIINISFANVFEGGIGKNAAAIQLYEVTEAGVRTTLTDANFADNSSIVLSAIYFV